MTPAELKREILTQRIEAAIESTLASLVEQVVELVPVLVREQLETVLNAAILENPAAAPAKTVTKRRPNVLADKAESAVIGTAPGTQIRVGMAKPTSSARNSGDSRDRPALRETTKGKPRERAVMKCSKCGEVGKRSDSCGITHNVKQAAKASKIVKRPAPVVVTPDTPLLEPSIHRPTSHMRRLASPCGPSVRRKSRRPRHGAVTTLPAQRPSATRNPNLVH